jgi:hypothetical protein
MPLSLDDLLVQPSSSGSFEAASGDASLPTATTAGSTVLIACTCPQQFNPAPPSGFANDSPTQGSNLRVYLFRRSNVPAGETAWTLTPLTSALVRWTVYEVAGLDLDAPLDVILAGTAVSTQTGVTASSGTTPLSSTYDGLVVALHASYITTSTTPTTFSGHTGGMTEMDEGAAVGATVALNLSVSMRTTQQLATFESTATASATLLM